MGQLFTDGMTCGGVSGRYFVDLRTEKFPAKVQFSVDGGPTKEFTVETKTATENTGLWKFPYPGPRDGKPHTIVFKLPSGETVSKTLPACTGEAVSVPGANVVQDVAASGIVSSGKTVPPSFLPTMATAPSALKAGGIIAGIAALLGGAWWFTKRRR